MSSSIQTASMDGANLQTLHSTRLVHPNDISLDIPSQKIYWTDGVMGTIEFSDYNGANRGQFLLLPSTYLYGMTLDPFLVFFGEWQNNTIRYAHKIDAQSPTLIINDDLTVSASGMVLVYPDRQPTGT